VLNTERPASWPNLGRLWPSAGRSIGRPLRCGVFDVGVSGVPCTLHQLCSDLSVHCGWSKAVHFYFSYTIEARGCGGLTGLAPRARDLLRLGSRAEPEA
jgi:hypothetical protein